MGLEKAELIAQVYETEAGELEKQIEHATKEMHEHRGAEQALKLIAQQMPTFADKLSEAIEADEDLTGEAGNKAYKYVRQAIARIQTLCAENGKNQNDLRGQARGRMITLQKQADNFRKKAAATRATAVIREEVAEANRPEPKPKKAAAKKTATKKTKAPAKKTTQKRATKKAAPN